VSAALTPEFADLDNLVEQFVGCSLPKREWTHSAHLAVGLWHVAHHGAEDALVRLRAGIRRLNESHGVANSATAGYHETITRAYVRLLDEFLATCPAGMVLLERVRRLLDSALAHKDALATFYSREVLMSTVARAGWVEPDRAPLQLSYLDRATGKRIEAP
jgi:hypothetical protein